jgi:sucrose-6-phosphate hydrolase SacC (GH32 family)
MAVYAEQQSDDGEVVGGISFYRSDDLKSWEWTSWIAGFHECPDLVQLAVDDDETDRRWVLSGAAGDYLIGEFDGLTFVPTAERLPAPTGDSAQPFYAAQTYSNHPNGSCVQMAWGQIHADGAPFSQVMLVPTVLSLRTTASGIRLCREPVDALRSLRVETHRFEDVRLAADSPLPALSADAWDLEARLAVTPGGPIELQIGADTYSYSMASQVLSGPRGSMHIPLGGDELVVRILVDRTTVEVFGGRGEAYGVFARTDPGQPAELGLRAAWGFPRARIVELLAHELAST